MTEPWTLAFLVILSLTSVHAIVGLAFFIYRRHLHPMRGHSLGLVKISSVSMTVAAWAVCIQIIVFGQVSCSATMIAIISGIFAAVVGGVRGWRIIIFYLLAVEKVNRSQAIRKNATRSAGDTEALPKPPEVPLGLLRCRRFLTDRYFVALTMLVGTSLALFSAVPLMVQRSNVNFNETTDFCPELQITNRIYLVVLALGLMNNSIILWKLRVISDAYCIKWDLAMSFIAYCAVGIAVAVAATGGSNLLYGRARVTVYVISINIILFATTTWKVLKSLKQERHQPGDKSESTRLSQMSTVATLVSQMATATSVKPSASGDGNGGTGGVTNHGGGHNTGDATGIDIAGQIDQSVRNSFLRLEDILANAEVLELFREHLKREWAVENLLFLEAVTDFAVMFESPASELWRLYTDDDRIKMALSIYWTYVFHDAPSRINISSDTYHDLNITFQRLITRCAAISLDDANSIAEHVIDPPPADVFNRAAHEIRLLMEIDSFRNFKSSDLFSRHVASHPASLADNAKP